METPPVQGSADLPLHPSQAAPVAVDDASPSLWRDAWARLRRNRIATLSLFILLTIIGFCIVAPLFLQNPDQISLPERNQRPSAQHWFGTDNIGRDQFSRTINGGRVSLLVAFVATAVSVTIGVSWGALAGYLGGRVDSLLMRVVDILYALPFLVIVVLLSLYLGPPTARLQSLPGLSGSLRPYLQLVPLFLAIGALSWLTVSRIVRAQVLSLKNQEFVQAARSLGLSGPQILFRHIVPNVLGPVIVYTTLAVPGIMLLEATLSFLGLGVKPPFATWGSLIKDGADRMEDNPGLLLYPALLFSTTLFALNFLGDGLRDALDVRAAKD